MSELVILIGPPGCGKTKYANSLKRHVRISQDDQGKIRHTELFMEAIEDGKDIVVDRMNFNPYQRQWYIRPAREAGYKIKCVQFNIGDSILLDRLAKRINHPTISVDDDHVEIIDFYHRSFVAPTPDECDEFVLIEKNEYVPILDMSNISGRAIVIGDIHGCYDALIELLEKCKYNSVTDTLFLAGDLVDRGPQSREVLEWLMSNKDLDIFCVEGNHDNKFKRYLMGNPIRITNGLDATIRQCENMHQPSLVQFLSNLPAIIRLPNICFIPVYLVHAGVDPKRPIDKQNLETCLYARGLNGNDYFDTSGGVWYNLLDGSYSVVCGHIVHENPLPNDHVFCLDGGACHGGVLRAMVIDNDCWEIIEVPGLAEKYVDGLGPVAERDRLVADGLLRCDNLDDLRVYTYTDKCVHQNKWDEITLNSRGVIFNTKTGEIVAQPFGKFFNLNEHPTTQEKMLLWDGEYEIFDKVDGWLGTLYRHAGQHKIATRGSFHSTGAVIATEMLQKHNLANLPNEVTLVFEIVTPETHIIINYDYSALVLLAAFNRDTGEEYDRQQVVDWSNQFGFRITNEHPSFIFENTQAIVNTAKNFDGTRDEGFVIRFANGQRVKIKSEDYMRRSRLLQNLTPLSVWREMKCGIVHKDFMDLIDPEYRDMIKGTISELQFQYQKIEAQIYHEYKLLSGTRKDVALQLQGGNFKHKAVMFACLDAKNESIEKYIMKLIKPKGNVLEKTNVNTN